MSEARTSTGLKFVNSVNNVPYYHNCLSTFCPENHDPQKTHGDVAEFYDGSGDFMGLAVYMGDEKYCSLPYDGYKK